MAVKPMPEGYHSMTPMLVVQGAGDLIRFAKEAFGAEERSRMPGPKDTVAHAELKIGDSIVMVADPGPTYPAMPTYLYLYVADVDKTYGRALEAGGTAVEEPKDQFWGDRTAEVKDGSGNRWTIATHTEDLTPEQMQKRVQEWTAQQASR